MKKHRGIFLRIALGTLIALALFFHGALAFTPPMVFYSGDEDVPKIAITMDDCWKLGVVKDMLDLCQEYDFRMTFFPCGTVIHEEDRDLWLRMVNEGHEIGNHTQNHRRLTNLSHRRIGEELRFMENRLNKALGYEYPLRLVRPPYGSGAWGETGMKIGDHGYRYIILWRLGETDPDKMLKEVRNGDILLYHSNPKDVKGLRKAIPILLERGYQLVTVSELLNLPPAVETDGATADDDLIF